MSSGNTWVAQALDSFERPLVRYARRLVGDAEAARDIAQDCFLKLCRQRQGSVEGHLREWLFTVCRYRCIDHLRKSGRMDLIEDLSHVFTGGVVTALVGPSGCGKTTLEKLMAGLYPYQSGNIRYGSYNQADLPLDCLRQQIILVPQEPHFWSRSILDNFRFVFPDTDFASIVEACELTGADQFIAERPDK